MKLKHLFIFILTMCFSNAFSQEIDDMYFTAKDRVKKPVIANKQSDYVIPMSSDSYSGRNQNPDYSGSSTTNSAYFKSNYQPNINQNLYSTSYNFYPNYTYNYGYGFYPSYSYGFYPYWFGYNFGFGYGYQYMYGYPYGYYPYSYPYYNVGYYSTYTYVTHVPDNHVVYGRRPSRSSVVNNNYYTPRTNRNVMISNNINRSSNINRSNWNNSTSRSWNNSSSNTFRNNSSFSTPSRNWNSGFSGGSRGFSGGGFSGGGGHVGGGGHGRR